MESELRNLGVSQEVGLGRHVDRAVAAALDRFDDRVRRVRVRLMPDGKHQATCRIRVWCEAGPTVIVEQQAATSGEAIDAVVAAVNQVLKRRFAKRRQRRRHPTDGSRPGRTR